MKIATLIYVTDSAGRFLLLKREREPNIGLWSPIGGKYEEALRESMYESAAREASEELMTEILPGELRLRGMAFERGIAGSEDAPDWLMFLFAFDAGGKSIPTRSPEGELRWFEPGDIDTVEIPETDRVIFWPLIRSSRPFFSVTVEWDGERVASYRIEGETGA